MHSTDRSAVRVVTAVLRAGTPATLVEDTWTQDDRTGLPESLRTWTLLDGMEIRTTTSAALSGADQPLAVRVIEALSGAAMEHAIATGAPREALVAAVQRARGAGVHETALCLTVDSEPHSGLSASADGITARAVQSGSTVVVTVSDGDPVAVALDVAGSGVPRG